MKRIANYYFRKTLKGGYLFPQIGKFLEKSQFYSKTELAAYQNSKLKDLINHSYRNVPYYTDLFNKLNIDPEDIKTKEDLEKIPYLDKSIVNENFDKLIAKNANKFMCRIATTSGSTGTPAKFLRDLYSINYENAVVWRLWKNAGDTGLKRITLKGPVVVPVSQMEPPFWTFNPADNELFMSCYHFSKKNSKHY